ncbi:CHAT domain-containing protein [Myxococcota bacterium]|nr:CHAT domain-containing protein [Myxococcota bacterium]
MRDRSSPRRWARAAVLAALAALGCRENPAPARGGARESRLEVEVAGCATLRVADDAPICGLASDRRLRFVLPADAGAAGLTGAKGVLTAGQAAVIVVDEGASEVSVVADTARFVLRVERPVPESTLDELTALRKARRLDEARQRVEALLAAPPPELAGRLHGHAARIALAAGDPERAAQHFTAAAPLHAAAGRLSERVNDALALAFVQIHQLRDFPGARRTLGDAAPYARFDPEGAAALRVHHARLALETGDVRSALHALDDAEPRLARLDAGLRLSVARQARAEALQAAGRHAEAVDLLRSMHAAAADSPCARASIENDLGWALLLLAGEAPPAEPTAVDALFTGVVRAFAPDGECPQPAYVAGAHLNRALLALRLGDAAAARAALAAGQAALPTPDARLALWWPDVEGRAALLAGDPRGARRHFERLRALGAATASAEAVWRGTIGLARAARAAGEDAGPAFADAFEQLADQAMRIPLAEGRESFLAERDAGTRDHVDFLIERGRTAEAMTVVRRARARFLAALRQAERLPALTPAARARWETALADHRRARAALDAEAADDWKRPADALAQARAARGERQRALRIALDAAFAVLAEPAAERAGAAPSPPTPPAPGELVLTWLAGPDGTLAFAADVVGTSAVRIAATPGGIGAPRAPSTAAEALLAPFSDRIRAARKLRVLPHGPARGLDLHAAMLDGAPVLARLPVVYGLDLPPRPPTSADDARTLLVADPRGDLPGARLEGDAVAAALGATPLTRLVGEAATGDAVRRALGATGRFHYAGHGRFGGPTGWESTLPLAADGALTLDDILALPNVPALVVLSGCETARQADAARLEQLGLAQAFLAAGAHAAVAATRPVADTLATALSTAFYGALAHAPPEEALQTAQLTLRARSEAQDWATFRILVR